MTRADLVEQVAEAVGPRVTKRDCGRLGPQPWSHAPATPWTSEE